MPDGSCHDINDKLYELKDKIVIFANLEMRNISVWSAHEYS